MSCLEAFVQPVDRVEPEELPGSALPFPVERMISHLITTMTELQVPESKIHVNIHSGLDIVAVRQKGRALAEELDFSPGEATLFAAVISELGRDILAYAHSGEFTLEPLQKGQRVGIKLTATFGDGSTPRSPNVPVRAGVPTDWFALAQFGGTHLLEEIRFHSQPGSGVTLTGIKWRM